MKLPAPKGDDNSITMGDCFDPENPPKKGKKTTPSYPANSNLESKVDALSSKVSCFSGLIAFFVVVILALIGGTLGVVVYSRGELDFMRDASTDVNPCAGAKVDIPNAACATAIADQVEQSGREITAGYTAGNVDNSATPPITTTYTEAGLCPVNVHWHLGAEHKSAGEYDENGSGPTDSWATSRRRLASSGVRLGMQCGLYNTVGGASNWEDYDFKYCKHMKVGQTYEVHWPHSSVGDCGTKYQYQTPFYDGVFCNFPEGGASTHDNVGVQAQVFTIINNEDFYVPNLIEGMLVDFAVSFIDGERWVLDPNNFLPFGLTSFGTDLAYYTGSTTGTSRDADTTCSFYSPITWQVDRECHLISASSFDKMCYDMLQQGDDMSDDIYPHGARELVVDPDLISPQV